ncbi:MAG: type III secretion system export apparatus subunit SctR [Pseudomonadota bacterium]|nr:type III secretion system export apparatus subunit SctR [Pseudomonadota bacterium]|tara:strand:- start:38093 stop:38755 length:663 start_codon:yes stop_codon:yes gene_type:complete
MATDDLAVVDLLKSMHLLYVFILVPFIAISATSFLKISLVLSLIRNAIGLQQTPPNTVIYSLSLILTVFIMKPIFIEIYDVAKTKDFMTDNTTYLMEAFDDSFEPLKNFLYVNSRQEQKQFFIRTAQDLWPAEYRSSANDRSVIILIPAFIVDELTEAFKMIFLIYLPFLIIDLITSNVLLSLGMMMVSPMTISLPLKILLFVAIDGWSQVIQSLVVSFN